MGKQEYLCFIGKDFNVFYIQVNVVWCNDAQEVLLIQNEEMPIN